MPRSKLCQFVCGAKLTRSNLRFRADLRSDTEAPIRVVFPFVVIQEKVKSCILTRGSQSTVRNKKNVFSYINGSYIKGTEDVRVRSS